MMRQGGRAVSRLVAIASRVTIPESLRTAWTGPAPELAAGQIWRGRWGDTVQLVVIVGIDSGVTALPLSFDVGYTEPGSALIPTEANPFKVPLVAWRSLRRDLPSVVLDRFAGDMAVEATTVLSQEPPGGDETQLPLHVRHYRALIEDTMDELASADWHPRGSGELGTRLKSAGLRPQDVGAALGTTSQRALAILRGQAPLTGREAEMMATVLHVTAQSLLTTNPVPPSDLISQLDGPNHHHQVLAWAASHGSDVPTAYRDVAYRTWALAARQTGKSAVDWDARLDTFFAAVADAQ